MRDYHETQEHIAVLHGEFSVEQRTIIDRCWQQAMAWLQQAYPELCQLLIPTALAEERFLESTLRVRHKSWQGHEAEIVREAKLHLLQEHLAYQKMLQAEGGTGK